MVPLNLRYYRADSVDEALELFQHIKSTEGKPIFYGGGTEILTRARVQDIDVDAVIDLKGIPALHVHQAKQGQLEFGAALRLTEVSDKNLWPLLTATADRVADHTSRGQITLGGNLLSILPYREAILPFLVSDSATVVTAGPEGTRTRPLPQLLHETLRLAPGELLISLRVDQYEAMGPRFKSRKMTRIDWIDYPLVTIVVTRSQSGKIRAAFSGWTTYPFTSKPINDILSDEKHSLEERAQQALQHMPEPALTDIHGSRQYREFVSRNTLASMLKELEDTHENPHSTRTSDPYH